MIIKKVQKNEKRKKRSAKTGGEVKSAIQGTRSLISDEVVEPADVPSASTTATSLELLHLVEV